MDDTIIQSWKGRIDQMSHQAMARLWRFAPAGHPCFDTRLPLFKYFQERFQKLGGMTTAVSKAIGH